MYSVCVHIHIIFSIKHLHGYFFWSIHLKGKLHAGKSCCDDQLIHYSTFINTCVYHDLQIIWNLSVC